MIIYQSFLYQLFPCWAASTCVGLLRAPHLESQFWTEEKRAPPGGRWRAQEPAGSQWHGVWEAVWDWKESDKKVNSPGGDRKEGMGCDPRRGQEGRDELWQLLGGVLLNKWPPFSVFSLGTPEFLDIVDGLGENQDLAKNHRRFNGAFNLWVDSIIFIPRLLESPKGSGKGLRIKPMKLPHS